ncbi:MAG: hypothetical protein WAM92_15220 [Mycobacterium sp.]
MSLGPAVAVALTFVWLDMVLAISFLEAPLKFRAPGVTLQIGLSIGRLVFRALNTAEVILAVGILIAVTSSASPVRVVVPLAVALVALTVQLLAVRPRLTRRSDAVLRGDDTARRSRGHYVYVALEVIKVIALAAGGILLLTG